MSQTKTEEELKLMKISGHICAKALKKVVDNIKPGITGIELDNIARIEIEKNGASSSFVTVDDYKWTICLTVNNQVVHGVPTMRKVQEGEIIGIDIGALYKGFHSDMATTIPVGNVSESTTKFLKVGQMALEKAIKEAKIGNRIGDISQTLQETIEGSGYSIVKSLTGHGVGRQLHEEPMIPGFGKSGLGPQIKEKMVLAIEAIYAQKSGDVYLEKDGWTISTQDGSLGGLFEKTIAVTKNGPIVLTPYL